MNARKERLCPKCSALFEAVRFGMDLELHRCTECKGLLLERSALMKLRDAWLADEVIDIGDIRVGKRHDKIKPAYCPDCQNAMEVIFDEQQKHIAMEYCADCQWIYLDAGELTDLKYLTLMDFVPRFLFRSDKNK